MNVKNILLKPFKIAFILPNPLPAPTLTSISILCFLPAYCFYDWIQFTLNFSPITRSFPYYADLPEDSFSLWVTFLQGMRYSTNTSFCCTANRCHRFSDNDLCCCTMREHVFWKRFFPDLAEFFNIHIVRTQPTY